MGIGQFTNSFSRSKIEILYKSLLGHVYERRYESPESSPNTVEFPHAALQPSLDLPQGVGTPQLAKEQGHNLSPARQACAAGFGSRLLDEVLKVGAGNELEKLTKHAPLCLHVGLTWVRYHGIC